MTNGLFLIGTDRGVGKTLVGVGITALLRRMGVDATLMTPISTGGSIEHAAAMLAQIGVEDSKRLLYPVTFETLAAPYVASRVEGRPVDIGRIREAYHTLREGGKFVVVEGAGAMVPITRQYTMIDLVKDFALPSLVVARSGRGTLNHCLLTQRMMLAMGLFPSGFILNGYGQYGEGFAESLNPDVLAELAAPTPVLATMEWRPDYQQHLEQFIRALDQPALSAFLRQTAKSHAA